MPKVLNTADQAAVQLPNSAYGYSATKMDKLGSTEYSLVTILADCSGSTGGFQGEMEKAIEAVVNSCKFSPRADSLQLRLLAFDDVLTEIHGFKLLTTCNPSDYNGVLFSKGCTALKDSAHNAVEATVDYAKKLYSNEFSANGLIVILTDGCDNVSRLGAGEVKRVLEAAKRSEVLESITTVLIGVNTIDPGVAQELQDFKNDVGIGAYIDMGDVTPEKLAKLSNFISKSINTASKMLGQGAAATQQAILGDPNALSF